MEIIEPKSNHISTAHCSKQLILGYWAFLITLFPNVSWHHIPKFTNSILWRTVTLPLYRWSFHHLQQKHFTIREYTAVSGSSQFPWCGRCCWFTIIQWLLLLDPKLIKFICYIFLSRPVNILNSFSRHNRFSIAATFGATASTCVNLFVHTFVGNGGSGLITLTGPPWVKGK